MSVLKASTANPIEFVEQLRGHRRTFRNQRIVDAVDANFLNGLDRGGCSHAECFRDAPIRQPMSQFFHRDAAYLHGNTQVLCQLKHRVTGYTIQDGFACLGRNQCPVEYKHGIHGSAFFDVLVLLLRPSK